MGVRVVEEKKTGADDVQRAGVDGVGVGPGERGETELDLRNGGKADVTRPDDAIAGVPRPDRRLGPGDFSQPVAAEGLRVGRYEQKIDI